MGSHFFPSDVSVCLPFLMDCSLNTFLLVLFQKEIFLLTFYVAVQRFCSFNPLKIKLDCMWPIK